MSKLTLKIYQIKNFYFKGEDLQKIREELGMTQDEFADAAGWTQQEQSKLERPGAIHVLSRNKLLFLHSIGVKIHYLRNF